MNMKRFTVLCLVFIFILAMTGCESDVADENKEAGAIVFYKEPTLEKTEPSSIYTYKLTKKQKDKLQSIIDSVKKWTDDSAVDRLPYYFDGEFAFSDGEKTYFFSYESNIIYYDRFFGVVSSEQMQYIKALNTSDF